MVGTLLARPRIGVYGSWRDEGPLPPEALSWAYQLGHLVGTRGHILVTGGSRGVAFEARRGCSEAGGLNLAVLPDATISIDAQKQQFR